MENIRIRVVLKPSESTAQLLVRLSEEVSTRGKIRFKLGLEANPPHCTIGKLTVSENEVDKIHAELKRAVGGEKLPSIGLSGLNHKKGYVGLDLIQPPELIELYSKVFAAFEEMETDSAFDPHVTLARFWEESCAAEVARSFPDELILELFTASAVGIYRRGEEDGTCSKLLAEVPLGHKDSQRRRIAAHG